MRLVTIAGSHEGTPGAVLASGEIVDLRLAAVPATLGQWLPRTLREILAGGKEGLAIVRGIVDDIEGASEDRRAALRAVGAIRPAGTSLLAPIPKPGLVVAAGLAYRSHLAEMAGTPAPPHPTGFMKSANSVAGPGGVSLPPDAPEQVDFEGELAVVFGRRCHRVTANEAMDCVAGYTAANDFSARDWVRGVWSATSPWEARLSWEVNIMGKQFPGFTATGPVLLTSDELPDPAAARLTTRINGATVQDAPVGDMIFDIAATIAHFAQWYVFEPGDILLTGTPAGVGVGRKPPLFLNAGDTVEVEISGIGILTSLITN